MIVNALSGGKTSGYIGMNYPADLYIFALVCVDDVKCASPDKFLMQYANDKIAKYCANYGEVLGTAESPTIFKTMFDLEQLIGKEIVWLRGESFDQLIARKKALPATHKFIGRFCTTWLKIHPFFEFWLKYNNNEKWGVNEGYRYDEENRVSEFTTSWKYAVHCNNYGKRRQKWETVEWRYGQFPLIAERKLKFHINDYWKGRVFTLPRTAIVNSAYSKRNSKSKETI